MNQNKPDSDDLKPSELTLHFSIQCQQGCSCCKIHHVLLGCYPVFFFALCSPMHFSQSFIYKCLLTDQTSPRSYGGVKLMPGAQGEKKQKREAIILSIHRRFLLLFHPLEAQEVHPQTIWYLEICCLGGMPRAQQHPQGPRGPLPHLLSPTFHGVLSFMSSLITLLPGHLLPGLQHLCCITVQKTIPTLRQANCISFVSLAQLQKSHWN